jgi:hypothetical protein
VVIARFTAGLLPRTGVRRLVLAGGALLAAGFGWLGQADADSGYLAGVLVPTLLVAAGIGLTFPTLMAAATVGAPADDAGIVGGLANTATQIGGSVGLAVLATVAGSTGSAAGYDRVFFAAAGLGLAIAAISVLLPRRPAA